MPKTLEESLGGIVSFNGVSRVIDVVRAIVINHCRLLLTVRGGGLLLGNLDSDAVRLCLPGGKLNDGEFPYAGLQRKVSEELGQQFCFLPYYDSIDNTHHLVQLEQGANGVAYRTHYIRGSGDGQILPKVGEVKAVLWLPIPEVLGRRDLAFSNNGQDLRNVLHLIEHGRPMFPLAVDSPLPVSGILAVASHSNVYK